MGWTLGKDRKTLLWDGGGAAPMLSGKEQKAQRNSLKKGTGLVKGPSPGVSVDRQGKPRLPGRIDPEGTPPPGSGNVKFFGHGGQLPSGVSMVGGMPSAADTSFAGPKDSIFSWPDGHKTVLMANGLSVDVPAAAAAAAEHGGGGGGGGGDNLPDLQSDLKAPAVQQIPFPQQAQASSLGAPNQTWDWLLETLAAPGLLSPSLNLLGTYLAQNSTANNAGYSPMITQQNFGGLFGSPTSPPPFLSQPPAPFLGQTIADAQRQSYTGLPLQQVSGGMHPGNLMSGGGTINPMAVGPGGSFGANSYPPMVGGGFNGMGLLGNTQAGGASSRK